MGVSGANGIRPNGDWVWIRPTGSDFLFNVRTNEQMGPWSTTADFAAWDVAGQRLWRKVQGQSSIEVVNPQAGTSLPLQVPAYYVQFAIPATDGNQVLLGGSLTPTSPSELLIWRRLEDEVFAIPSVGPTDFNRDTAVWSPDATKLAWVRDGQLHHYDIAADHYSRVSSGVFALQPEWSPDSSRLAITIQSSGSRQVQLYDHASSGLQTLTSNGDDLYLPTWSRDAGDLLVLSDDSLRILDSIDGQLISQAALDLSSISEVWTWQRPLELWISSEVDNELSLLRLSGSFAVDDFGLMAGDNEVVGFATPPDGTRSGASESLLIMLSEQALPNLYVHPDSLRARRETGEATVLIEALVENRGQGSSESAFAFVTLSPVDGGPDISELIAVPPLSPSQQWWISLPVTEIETDGLHDLLIEVDPFYQLVETTREDNIAFSEVLIGVQQGVYLHLSAADTSIAHGDPLELNAQLINSGPTLNGTLDLSIVDAGGHAVATLDASMIQNLGSGQSWSRPVTWHPEGLLAGYYRAVATLTDDAGEVIQVKSLDFMIELEAELTLILRPNQSHYLLGETANIEIGVSLDQSNGVLAQAALSLVASTVDGVELERWDRQLGTLLPGYESLETLNW
ncbi:MAG: hypothetical protein AAGJ52_11155, partial [Pseudomonadota bacterium]